MQFLVSAGVWHQMVQEGNDTEVNVDPLALPTGMYYDWREVCRQVDNKKDKTYLLPIYRKKSKEYHEEVRKSNNRKCKLKKLVKIFKFFIFCCLFA